MVVNGKIIQLFIICQCHYIDKFPIPIIQVLAIYRARWTDFNLLDNLDSDSQVEKITKLVTEEPWRQKVLVVGEFLESSLKRSVQTFTQTVVKLTWKLLFSKEDRLINYWEDRTLCEENIIIFIWIISYPRKNLSFTMYSTTIKNKLLQHLGRDEWESFDFVYLI